MITWPGLEMQEYRRIPASKDVMIQRCPVCFEDVDAYVVYSHLMKADFEWAMVIDPALGLGVRQLDYMLFTDTLEPCGHDLIPSDGGHAAIMQATMDFLARPGPPYLITWWPEALP